MTFWTATLINECSNYSYLKASIGLVLLAFRDLYVTDNKAIIIAISPLIIKGQIVKSIL